MSKKKHKLLRPRIHIEFFQPPIEIKMLGKGIRPLPEYQSMDVYAIFMHDLGRKWSRELDRHFDIMFFHSIPREDNQIIGLS